MSRVRFGEVLADLRVVGVVGGEGFEVFEELVLLLAAEVDPGQALDPLRVVRVVLAADPVEGFGLVEVAGLQLQLGEEAEDLLVRLVLGSRAGLRTSSAASSSPIETSIRAFT